MTLRARMRSVCAVVSVALALASPRVAVAQEDAATAGATPSDEELLARGVELRKRGQDAEALAVFQRAYEQHPSGRALAQVALAHQALGNWRDAERELIEALSHGDDGWVVRQRIHLEGSLAAVQGHLASLAIESNVAGAEVWIAGQLVGRLPLQQPFRVVAGGETTLEVRAPGYSPIARVVEIEPGARMNQVFRFVPPQALPSPAVEGVAAPSPHPAEESSSGARRAGWIALSTAGALLLVGIGGAVTRESEASIYNDDGQCGPVGGESRQARCGTNRDIGSTAEVVAIAAFAGSGIAAVTSAVLLIGADRFKAAARARDIECGFGVLRFACAASF